jgi:glycosyltransferase involved in cell wall biosynthesis
MPILNYLRADPNGFDRYPINDDPAVSIVVPCCNERDYIESMLQSILQQEQLPGRFEVIVIDGMSEDGTREVVLRFAQNDSRIRIIDNPQRIASTGLNAGIKVARGSIVIRMDAHTSYAPDYIKQCVQVLQDTDADNVGGPCVVQGRGLVGKVIAFAFQSSFGCGGARGHDPRYSGPVDTVYLGCWRREIFDRIGLFDEELVRNQDDELNLRLIRSGGIVWQSAKIKSRYYPRERLRDLFAQYLQYGYWKAFILQKHRLPASVRHLIPAVFVLTLLLLPFLSLFWPIALRAWTILVALYVLTNVLVSIITAARKGCWYLFALLPCVFTIFHIAYGWGFLTGIADLIIMKEKLREQFSGLTRVSCGRYML